MKLSRPPRLFGSSAKTAEIVMGNNNSKDHDVDDVKDPSKKGRKSPLAAFKHKLTMRQQSSSSNVNDFKKENSKRSTETSSPDNSNSNVLEEEEAVEAVEKTPVGIKQQQSQENEEEEDDGGDADTVSVEQDKEPLAPTPQSPQRRRRRSLVPKTLFQPPPEVMIDPHAVPPSPMRDPAMHSARTSDQQHLPGLLLDMGNNSSDNLDGEEPYTLGDPLGDIAMKRQLLDAQRLVRLILGKPLCGDQQLLDTATILQAIRAFAMMKQEVTDLRKKQEIADGDPPAILQMLGSPVGTTPTSCTTGLETPSSAFSFHVTAQQQNAELVVGSPPPQSPALEEANAKVECLQQQLAEANEKIHKMQQQQASAPGPQEVSPEPAVSDCDQEICCKHRQAIDAKYQELVKVHEASVEESQRNLDAVIESVASVPKKVLAKDSVREKLKAYCATVTNHAAQLQRIEMEERMQRERDESQRIIQELQDRLKAQESSSYDRQEVEGKLNEPHTTSSITLELLEEKKVDA